ncbi:MAG: hypothetical protein WA139_03280 [Candidatus Aenigmatarchaeota archaeon]
MTIYLADGEMAEPFQFLYAPDSNLIAWGNGLFHFIPYYSESSKIELSKISDFIIKGMPKNIFMAESSKKEKLGANNFRNPKEEALAKYFEIGSISSVDDTTAEVLFLKDSLNGKVIDTLLLRVMEEKSPYIIVNFNEDYPNVLEMKYIPVVKREQI